MDSCSYTKHAFQNILSSLQIKYKEKIAIEVVDFININDYTFDENAKRVVLCSDSFFTEYSVKNLEMMHDKITPFIMEDSYFIFVSTTTPHSIANLFARILGVKYHFVELNGHDDLSRLLYENLDDSHPGFYEAIKKQSDVLNLAEFTIICDLLQSHQPKEVAKKRNITIKTVSYTKIRAMRKLKISGLNKIIHYNRLIGSSVLTNSEWNNHKTIR